MNTETPVDLEELVDEDLLKRAVDLLRGQTDLYQAAAKIILMAQAFQAWQVHDQLQKSGITGLGNTIKIHGNDCLCEICRPDLIVAPNARGGFRNA
jgi:hypothetical protein